MPGFCSVLWLALALGAAGAGSASAASLAGAPAKNQPGFGPNVTIFDPSMPVSEIQATVDAVYAEQVDAEMSTNRDAFRVQAGRVRNSHRAAGR